MRTFIAVKVVPEAKLQALRQGLSHMGKAVKAVTDAQMHVTLRFLGEIDPNSVPDLTRAIETATDGVEPFTMELQGIGAFPNAARPSVIWAGLTGADPLETIVASLSAELEELGIEPERRPWSAHLTLARVKFRPPRELAELFEKHRDTVLGRVPVRSIELIKSELTPQGPVYTDLASVTLG